MPSWTMSGLKPADYLNMNDRRSWGQDHGLRDIWKRSAWAHANEKRKPKITGLATVQVDFGVTDLWRKRDPSNWMPTVKAIVDSLTEARGFWTDDDSTRVTVREPRFVWAPIADYTVTITWEEPT